MHCTDKVWRHGEGEHYKLILIGSFGAIVAYTWLVVWWKTKVVLDRMRQ